MTKNVKKLTGEIMNLPPRMVRFFASQLGHNTDEFDEMEELVYIFIEEVVDKDSTAKNIFLAFKEVEDSVKERWFTFLRSKGVNV